MDSFLIWLERQGIHIREAQRMMKIANEASKYDNVVAFRNNRFTLIATLPEEEKTKSKRLNKANHQRSGELQEVKRRLKPQRPSTGSSQGESWAVIKQTKTTEKVIEIVHLYCIFKRLKTPVRF